MNLQLPQNLSPLKNCTTIVIYYPNKVLDQVTGLKSGVYEQWVTQIPWWSNSLFSKIMPSGHCLTMGIT